MVKYCKSPYGDFIVALIIKINYNERYVGILVKVSDMKNNFIQTMIITGVAGLVIVIIAIIYMMRLFGGEKLGPEVSYDPLTPLSENLAQENPASSSLTGVVHEIGISNIKVWDIEKNNYVEMRIKRSTQVKDAYERPISQREILLGALVELTYEKKSDNLLSIQESPNAWVETEVAAIDIDRDNKSITISKRQYHYTEELLILDRELNLAQISDINRFDTLKIAGVKDQIWSIQILEPAGYLKLASLPTKEGVLEIGNNKRYQLREIEDQIPLSSGEHKIVIHMDGYQPYGSHVDIIAEEVHVIDLRGVEEITAHLSVRVSNSISDYTVRINNTSYKKGDQINIKPGKYPLKVMAEGFQTREMEVDLKEGNQRVNITLMKEGSQESKEEAKPNKSPNVSPSKKPEREDHSQEEKAEEITTVQIIIETDPQEAQVFVGGVYKGTTPALTGLKPGEYEITIEKEGYSTLYSTIIIDASNAKKGFLYTLQEEE